MTMDTSSDLASVLEQWHGCTWNVLTNGGNRAPTRKHQNPLWDIFAMVMTTVIM